MHIKTPFLLAAAAISSATLLAGCASAPDAAELDRQATAMMQASFRDNGIAKVDRLRQDMSNAECSKLGTTPPPEALGKAIEAANLKLIKWPADGRFLGDWKAGEALAQSGRGMTWSDKTTDPKDNGGNCYNCHQLSKAEISYGTIGPSLYQYGKLRGVSDPTSDAAKPIVEYTWGKLWNARAYNACSQMPRAGHSGVLNEQQIRDIMALLLDPKSPVNQ